MILSNKNRATGKIFVRSAIMLITLAGLLFCQFGIPAGQAQGVIGIEFIFDIVPDDNSLSALRPTGNTFYIQGKIYPFRTVNQATCQFNTATPRVVGTWRAWGEEADDGRLVMKQSLLLSLSNGTIELQGVTGVTLGTGPAGPAIIGDRNGPTTGPTEVVAVAGGAGAYRGLTGEAQIRPYCSDPSKPFRYDRPFCLQVIQGKRN